MIKYLLNMESIGCRMKMTVLFIREESENEIYIESIADKITTGGEVEDISTEKVFSNRCSISL